MWFLGGGDKEETEAAADMHVFCMIVGCQINIARLEVYRSMKIWHSLTLSPCTTTQHIYIAN